MSKFENNLVEGNVAKQLIIFAIPILLSNIIQSLYSVADMIIVGKFAGTISMSGVNIGSQITLLLTNLIIGLTVGATVLIGQYLGSGNKKGVLDTISTVFTTLIVAAVAITILMVIFQVPILKLIQTPQESFREARNYFFVTTLGMIFIFIYNAISSVMRGMGDSKNPLIFVTIAAVVNVILDLLLVAKFKMGATGAAVATVISQAVSVIISIIYLKRNNFVFDFKPKSFRCEKHTLSKILQVGVPSSVQNVAVSVSFLFLTAMVNSLGVDSSAAVGAVGKLNGFAILPGIAMLNAISAMSAQNIGANRYDRAIKTCFVGMSISIAVSVPIFILCSVFSQGCMRIFTDDISVITKGVVYIHSFRYDYIVAPIVFAFNGLFIGAGHTTFTLSNGLLSSLLVRIPSCYILGMTLNYGLKGIGLGAPLASFVALILCIIFYFSGKWKKQVI